MIGRRFLWAALGHAFLLGLFFWWTGLGDDSQGKVILSALAALVWILAFAWLQSRVFQGARWPSAFAAPRFWAALAFFAAAATVARLLVLWIPNVPGVGWQLFSLTMRFGLAWALVNAAWVGVAWQATLPEPEDGLAPMSRD
jgi:hypothetical protein